MLSLRNSVPVITRRFDAAEIFKPARTVVLCAAKGPRPRYPRVWKSRSKTGTVSKSVKLVECVKGLSNVKEEIYGALDSFIAWELEFPLITVKKALKALEKQKEWKRIIQVTKWMLSKGQGRTMGSYFMLLNALSEDGRLDEAEELWNKIFSSSLEATPRIFFDKMISIYHKKGMHEQMFEIFADMEELGVRPTVTTVTMVGDVFQQLGMLDKYDRLMTKYPTPKWEYRYVKGKRVRIRTSQLYESNSTRTALIGSGDGIAEDTEQQTDQDSGDERVTEDDEETSDGLVDECSSMSNEADVHGKTSFIDY